ncbi:putative cuticle protein [Operophtera brumata]|uniref:Putative cuticle protein n=1 Tax=Operophtera brumata TaxID=104452 RepID=A0A0L7LLT1_OPEBR|nr:putative cuticle protein [Operophtera brumata]
MFDKTGTRLCLLAFVAVASANPIVAAPVAHVAPVAEVAHVAEAVPLAPTYDLSHHAPLAPTYDLRSSWGGKGNIHRRWAAGPISLDGKTLAIRTKHH